MCVSKARSVYLTCVVLVMMLLSSARQVSANPTGAPLSFYPVQPCRILDTRVSLGAVPQNTGLFVYVRGNAIPAAQGGAGSTCNVPSSAEAVLVNIIVISPSSTGYLLVNGTGSITSPMGNYSRLNFNSGQTTTNEMTTSLCNVNVYPSPHVPCLQSVVGPVYSDFQMLSPTSSFHAVADVVGYYEYVP